jgi:hypothetical protein
MPAEPLQCVPLTCHGHSRPVPHISFSTLSKDGEYYLLSACKGEPSPWPSSPRPSEVLHRPDHALTA